MAEEKRRKTAENCVYTNDKSRAGSDRNEEKRGESDGFIGIVVCRSALDRAVGRKLERGMEALKGVVVFVSQAGKAACGGGGGSLNTFLC